MTSPSSTFTSRARASCSRSAGSTDSSGSPSSQGRRRQSPQAGTGQPRLLQQPGTVRGGTWPVRRVRGRQLGGRPARPVHRALTTRSAGQCGGPGRGPRTGRRTGHLSMGAGGPLASRGDHGVIGTGQAISVALKSIPTAAWSNKRSHDPQVVTGPAADLQHPQPGPQFQQRDRCGARAGPARGPVRRVALSSLE